MNTRLRLVVIVLGALLVLAVFTFPYWRPFVAEDVVQEPFQLALQQLTADQQASFRALATSNPVMAETLIAAFPTVVPVPTEQQQMPPMDSPAIVATGTFIQIDTLHTAQGTATIYQAQDGSRFLHFQDFRSTNGPELHVILAIPPDPRTGGEVGSDYVDLGRLKGNDGNQFYEIPPDVDLSRYASVVIYCLPFSTVFSTATLATV